MRGMFSSVCLFRFGVVVAVLTLAVVLTVPAYAQPLPAAPNAKGMRARLASCAVCHGKDGQGDQGVHGGVYPRLAGQPSAYLYKQLRRIKSAHRTGIPPVTTMQRLLSSLPDTYLELIAQFYNRATPPYPPRRKTRSDLSQEGRDIVHNGLPRKHVKACTQCHGADLMGAAPATPFIAGQNARYLTVQFDHWAQGARHNETHEYIARTLTMSQIEAVSAYLASLRPANATEAPQ